MFIDAKEVDIRIHYFMSIKLVVFSHKGTHLGYLEYEKDKDKNKDISVSYMELINRLLTHRLIQKNNKIVKVICTNLKDIDKECLKNI
jgi:hypothetical protein